MSLLSLPVELLFEIADKLATHDVSSFVVTSYQLHVCLIDYLYRRASGYKVTNAKSLTEGLREVSFWHDKTGNGSVLEWAAIHDCIGTFERLLSMCDIDVVQKDSYELTLLHRLSGQGMVRFMQSLIKRLIEDNKDPFETDKSCLTPLHFAAGCGKVEAVILLIAYGADVSAKDRHGNTPLHLAAVTGCSMVFESLIKAGAQINSETRFGWTAIDQASVSHQYTSVEELLRLGAQPPTWQEKKHALNQYIRLSPCPLEYCYKTLDF
jgi:hypothetical protein